MTKLPGYARVSTRQPSTDQQQADLHWPTETPSSSRPWIGSIDPPSGDVDTATPMGNVKLIFTGQDSPVANLMLSVMGAFAQFERALIGEREC
jgi:DNA invertase Pin-like site-specific DNA recombinase